MNGCLSLPVLVLNRNWQAVNIVDGRRAFSLLSQGHADVIMTEDKSYQIFDFSGWLDFSRENPPEDELEGVGTISMVVRLPKVLLLKFYDALPIKETRFSKETVFQRDAYQCQYCGVRPPLKKLNLDHVIPRDRGGKTSWDNVVTSCIRCNSHKANRLPHEAGMHLRREPAKPRWKPFASSVHTHPRSREWAPFLPKSG